MYLFNYLYLCGLMDFYFTLFCSNCSGFVHCSLFSWLWCLFDMAPSFSKHFLISVPIQCARFILYSPCPSFEHLSWWLRQWRIHLQGGRPRFDPWVGKICWRKEWQPTPVFLPGNFHGQRSLVGYSPWGHKESDMTEQLTHRSLEICPCKESWFLLLRMTFYWNSYFY